MAMPVLPRARPDMEAFLQPLRVDADRIYTMACEFSSVFTRLAAESRNQFLPTPVSESILLPLRQEKKKNQGRHLAIDIGGTNLRVGFIELLGDDDDGNDNADGAQKSNHNGNETTPPSASVTPEPPSLRRLHERIWPIQDHLKSQNADSLFAWIGSCIAFVVQDGCTTFGLSRTVPLPMGVTFSFPMEQESLAEAKTMSMGKGFALASKLDLGSHLVRGYDAARRDAAVVLPPIAIAAITNDAVSTLVSFVYEVPAVAHQRAVMGVICGTGCNATLLLKRSKLHPSKRKAVKAAAALTTGLDGHADDLGQDDEKIAVNTEWSINGSAPAMRAVNLISRWDEQLSQSVESPGFQPLEYMTAGRYLGELGRIMLLDYLTTVLGVDADAVPEKLHNKLEPRNTVFLGRLRPGEPRPSLNKLKLEYPTGNGDGTGFCWTEDIAEAFCHIAKAIETRAAAILAAAIMGLLDCADELPAPIARTSPFHLVVGYTGGCITHFQDYLSDCQAFLDVLVARRYSSLTVPPVCIVLRPCHDGGLKGAGILVPASLALKRD